MDGPRTHVLLMNVNGVLTDQTATYASGFLANPSLARTSVIGDFDNDGWKDVIVGNANSVHPPSRTTRRSTTRTSGARAAPGSACSSRAAASRSSLHLPVSHRPRSATSMPTATSICFSAVFPTRGRRPDLHQRRHRSLHGSDRDAVSDREQRVELLDRGPDGGPRARRRSGHLRGRQWIDEGPHQQRQRRLHDARRSARYRPVDLCARRRRPEQRRQARHLSGQGRPGCLQHQHDAARGAHQLHDDGSGERAQDDQLRGQRLPRRPRRRRRQRPRHGRHRSGRSRLHPACRPLSEWHDRSSAGAGPDGPLGRPRDPRRHLRQHSHCRERRTWRSST